MPNGQPQRSLQRTPQTFDFREHTMQETHDRIVTSLRKQRVASVNAPTTCLYRGPNGTMCALGHVLPDSAYTLDLEGNAATSYKLSYLFEGLPRGTRRTYIEYLRDMQKAHDSFMPYSAVPNDEDDRHHGRSLAAFEREAAVVAETYGLIHPPL